MKTAAVYDRWLYTLGGGEQVAFAYAETLRDLGYKVTILTHKEVDIAKAERKMHVDMRGITIEYLPLLSSAELSQFTEKFDIFVNTSHSDYFPSRSKLGILSVFFPSKIFLSPMEFLKVAYVVPSLRKFFIYPSYYEGFLYDQYLDGKIYKWLSKRSSIVFNTDVPAISILLSCRTMAFSVLDQMKFYLSGEEIFPKRRELHHNDNTIEYTFELKRSRNCKFTIEIPESEYAERIALLRLTILSPRYVLYNLFKQLFPKWEMRLHGGPGVTKRSDLESYDRIITISEFSRKWIRNYWHLDSKILYPPVNTSLFKPAKQKKNWIVHVGRFFVTGHSKKQLDLAQAFTRMVDEYTLKGWELHFVGSVHEGEMHRQYFEQVKLQSEGYPVHFHTDVTFSELQEILGQAKIYWHATGLDEHEDKNPIVFEHFGITTVEAMASGCVPVVIRGGGQREIVTAGTGFLWSTREELLEQTMRLIKDSELLNEYRENALQRAKYFDRPMFKERLKELLEMQ